MPSTFQGFYRKPPIGCCKLEQWNKRSYMRAVEKIYNKYTSLCATTNPDATVEFTCL